MRSMLIVSCLSSNELELHDECGYMRMVHSQESFLWSCCIIDVMILLLPVLQTWPSRILMVTFAVRNKRKGKYTTTKPRGQVSLDVPYIFGTSFASLIKQIFF